MKKILIIEHDPFRSSFLEQCLKDADYQVFALDNPVDSSFMVEDIDPDCILYSFLSFPEQWESFKQDNSKRLHLLISGAQIPGELVLLSPVSRAEVLSSLQKALA